MTRPLRYNARNATTRAALKQILDAKIVIGRISRRQTKVKFLKEFQTLIVLILGKHDSFEFFQFESVSPVEIDSKSERDALRRRTNLKHRGGEFHPTKARNFSAMEEMRKTSAPEQNKMT
jgi:hypothetical protein